MKHFAAVAGLLSALSSTPALAQHESTEELAKAAQNPVANMISVPFQNNTNFRTGPYGGTANTMNIQPVVPVKLNDDWNVISRTIIPVTGLPRMSSTQGSVIGIGDINPTFFLSPSKPGGLIWGVGPSFLVPSATEKILGTGKWSAGPAAVALVMPGSWVLGLLVSNLWSYAGDYDRKRVSQLNAQAFINYNMPGGWYLTSSPIITANWVARAGQQWTVPVGGGFGRVFKLQGQAINAQIAAYYNAIRPNDAPHWQLRAQLVFLFPQK